MWELRGKKRKDFILRGGSAARLGMAGAKEDEASTLRKGLQKVVVPGKVGLLAGFTHCSGHGL